MLAVRDNLVQCFSALRAHKLRASLTMLGLTMGVATLITVMTLVQGANRYVEENGLLTTGYTKITGESHCKELCRSATTLRLVSPKPPCCG